MLSISTSDEWRISLPGATIGVLELSGLDNHTGSSAALNERKREVEARLRERYKGRTRRDVLALPILAAYDRAFAMPRSDNGQWPHDHLRQRYVDGGLVALKMERGMCDHRPPWPRWRSLSTR